MNVSFYLHTNGTIMVSVSSQVGRMRLSIGDKISKNFWSNGKAVVSQAYDGRELNTRLKKIEMWWIDTIRRQQNDGVINKDTLIAAWNEYLGRRKKPEPVVVGEMIAFFDKWFPTTRYGEGRQYYYRRTRELLIKSGLDLRFDAVNKEWYNRWWAFLNDNVGVDSSVALYVSTVKHMMNEAFESGATKTVEHKKKYFRAPAYDSDQVYLTVEEIQRLYELQVSDPLVAYRRDMFVLTCFTGFRYSDWVKYRPENVIGGGTMLRVTTSKTGEQVVVPLHPTARAILDRHFKSPYSFPSNMTMNYNIKKVVRMLGLKDNITKNYCIGGRVKSVIKPMYQVVSCHTARRSFATNAYLAGLPVKTIMAFTGHRTMAAFERYIRVGKMEMAMKSMSHPFFAGGGPQEV